MMVFKEVTGNAIDMKTEVGNVIEGIYLGFKGITTDMGNQFIYKFRNKGRIIGVYGFTMLNKAMESVSHGSYCRVTYKGTENMKTKYGMKDVHMVKVEVDDEFEGNVEDITDESIPF
jgi:hypothetical protein